MSIGMILTIVLILFLIGALPTWPHSKNWGYYPSGGAGLVLVIVSGLLTRAFPWLILNGNRWHHPACLYTISNRQAIKKANGPAVTSGALHLRRRVT